VDPLRSAVAVLVPFATVPAMLVVPLSHMPDQSWNPETGVAEIDTLLPLRHTVCCDAVDGVPLPMVTVHQEITLFTVSSVPLQPLPLPDPELEDDMELLLSELPLLSLAELEVLLEVGEPLMDDDLLTELVDVDAWEDALDLLPDEPPASVVVDVDVEDELHAAKRPARSARP